MEYRLEITRTVKLSMDIEADSPEDAERQMWDEIDDAATVDSDTWVDTIIGEDGNEYTFRNHRWEKR